MQWTPRRRACAASTMCLLTFVGAGCAQRPATVAPIAAERVQVVRRTWAAPDTALQARAQGRLAVVVRSADRPMQPLAQARVQLATDDGAKAVASASADSVGHVVFDTVPVGRYRVTVSRLGYERSVFTVSLETGCRTDLEVYVGMAFVGIAPPPPTPARATATLCPVGDARRR